MELVYYLTVHWVVSDRRRTRTFAMSCDLQIRWDVVWIVDVRNWLLDSPARCFTTEPSLSAECRVMMYSHYYISDTRRNHACSCRGRQRSNTCREYAAPAVLILWIIYLLKIISPHKIESKDLSSSQRLSNIHFIH